MNSLLNRLGSSLILGLVAVLGCTRESEMKLVLSNDFRQGRFNGEKLKYVGRDATVYVKQDDKGLQFSFPANKPNLPQVGVGLREQLQGDFEITVSYQLMVVEKPKSGTASAIGIWVALDTDNKEGVALVRSMRQGDGDAFATFHGKIDAATGKREPKMRVFPATAATGKLRLRRVDSTASFLVAELGSEQFDELHKESIGNADVLLARVAAENGGAHTRFSVRVLELTVRASGTSRVNSLLVWLLICVLLISGIIWFWRHRIQQKSQKG